MKTKTKPKQLLEISPARFFIIVAVIFGLFFLFCTPPFQTPDEPAHFYRAYQVSEGHLIIDHIDNPRVNGGYLPVSLAKTVDLTTQSHGIEFQPDVKYNLHATKAALSIKEEPSKKQIYDLSATSSYSAIAYIPQAIGVLIGRVMHMPPIIMMYLGRLMNLAAWILLFVVAIRAMPYKKWALVAVGLLPMATFQAISLGVDVAVIGLSALAIALVLKLRAEAKPLSNKKLAILCGVFIALLLTKPIMFVFLPLILLIPTQNFSKGKAGWLKKALVIFVPVIIFAAWFVTTKRLSISSIPSNFNPQPNAQMKFILHDPFGYVLVLWKTYFFTNSDGIARSFIGTFGWVDAPISEFFAGLGYAILAFLMLANTKLSLPQQLARNEKRILLATIIAYWIAVTTALYVYYSPVRYKIIIGLQGRYFIPLALLLIPLLRGNWLQVSTKHYRRVATLAPVFMLLVSAITLYYRYYVHA